MNELIKKIFSGEDITEYLNDEENLQKFYQLCLNTNRNLLNEKKHIKKYHEIRKLHNEVISDLQDYMNSDKYDIDDIMSYMNDFVQEELGSIDYGFDFCNVDDMSMLIELLIYKTHPKLKSIIEIFLEKNKFRKQEKIKMLKAMNNSHVGLFEIIDVDRENGYITFEDVKTLEKFKVIDISMSSTHVIKKDNMVYSYNRIITYDRISFATGIHCMMIEKHKGLKQFINNRRYDGISNYSKGIFLYNLSKKNNPIKCTYHHE